MKTLKSKFKSNVIIFLKGADKGNSFSQDTVLNIEAINKATTLDQIIECLFTIFHDFAQEKAKEYPNLHSSIHNE